MRGVLSEQPERAAGKAGTAVMLEPQAVLLGASCMQALHSHSCLGVLTPVLSNTCAITCSRKTKFLPQPVDLYKWNIFRKSIIYMKLCIYMRSVYTHFYIEDLALNV